MDHSAQDKYPKQTVTVLVTGANSGLGFTTCKRLIDEFLHTRPQSQSLHLLFTTRDTAKSTQTLTRLEAHLAATVRAVTKTNSQPGLDLLLTPRIKLEGLLVDLTDLHSVKSLATQLLQRKQPLDAAVWNAGIAGWAGVNWPKAIWEVMTNLIPATTYPQYMRVDRELVTKPQTSGYDKVHTLPEPVLGQVFTANVFGHYLLTHWLAPVWTPDARIVWMGSISGTAETFDPNDLQGMRVKMPYEASKRLTDYLVLTSELPSTQPYVKNFLPSSGGSSTPHPRMYVVHPGVVATSISNLNAIMTFLMLCNFYIARWLGSPWHLVDPYKGSVSAVFAVLAPHSHLGELEDRDGKGKWGSAGDVFGNERVARTEVEGWAFGGKVGETPSGSLPDARAGYKRATKETREDFEDVGGRVWRDLEEMRVDWEARLGKVAAEESVDI